MDKKGAPCVLLGRDPAVDKQDPGAAHVVELGSHTPVDTLSPFQSEGSGRSPDAPRYSISSLDNAEDLGSRTKVRFEQGEGSVPPESPLRCSDPIPQASSSTLSSQDFFMSEHSESTYSEHGSIVSESSRDSRGFAKLRNQGAQIYDSFRFQILVAGLISANFVTNMIEKEIDPLGKKHASKFLILEHVYSILFTLELVINMYSHSCRSFWRSSWNIFDVVVVTIGIVNMMKLPLPESFSMLRMMRAFRVFRLFKRVKSLNKIVAALARAVPGVINAFVLLTIVMCIYAILAVELFSSVGQDCHEAGARIAPSTRGHCFGEEYFGTFSKSLFSFFQVLTGESWSEAVARPILWWDADPMFAVFSGLFFVSFILVTGFVLTNVVVAVLLDKMVEDDLTEVTKAVQDRENHEEVESASGISDRLLSIENQIKQLTESSAKMQAGLIESQKEMRDQAEAVLVAVKNLSRSTV